MKRAMFLAFGVPVLVVAAGLLAFSAHAAGTHNRLRVIGECPANGAGGVSVRLAYVVGAGKVISRLERGTDVETYDVQEIREHKRINFNGERFALSVSGREGGLQAYFHGQPVSEKLRCEIDRENRPGHEAPVKVVRR